MILLCPSGSSRIREAPTTLACIYTTACGWYNCKVNTNSGKSTAEEKVGLYALKQLLASFQI